MYPRFKVCSEHLASIRRWWNSWSFRGIYERTIEIILFIPVLYRCVTWDYTGLLKIMHHWLGRMEWAHKNDPHHLDSRYKIAEQIHTCRILLDRMIKDEYDDLLFEEHYKTYGSPRWNFRPIEDQPALYKLETDNVPGKHDDFLRICKHAEKQFITDMELLFVYFKKHLKSWWT